MRPIGRLRADFDECVGALNIDHGDGVRIAGNVEDAAVCALEHYQQRLLHCVCDPRFQLIPWCGKHAYFGVVLRHSVFLGCNAELRWAEDDDTIAVHNFPGDIR